MYLIVSHRKLYNSLPSSITSCVASRAFSESFSSRLFVILYMYSNFGIPTNSFIFSSVISESPSCIHLSRMLIPSLIAPSDSTAIVFSASSEIVTPISFVIIFSLFLMSSFDIFLKSNLWHLESIVAGNFCGSVVAKINLTCSGGSSNVFNRALNAPVDNMWTSSIIYTLYFALVGKKFTSSLICLISSTLLFEAASISTTSVSEPFNIPLHISHSLHGSPSFGFKQFIALAKTFAADVFPVPLPPLNKYACPTLPAIIWFFSVRVMCSWPTNSLKVNGLNFLYSAVYANLITPNLKKLV